MGNSGSQKVAVQIAVEKKEYVQGEVVRGYVQAQVLKPKKIGALFVRLKCNSNSTVHNKAPSPTVELLKLPSIRVAQGASVKVPVGTYQFAFEIALPENAPPSVTLGKRKSYSACVSYFLSVEQDDSGYTREDLAVCGIQVFSLPSAHLQPTLLTKEKYNFALCNAGKFLTTINLDKNSYSVSDSCTAAITVVNNTVRHITRMLIYVKEYVEIDGLESTDRTVGHVIDVRLSIPPSESGTSSVEIPINNMAPDIRSSMIKVKHKLVVKVITSSAFAFPTKFKIPLEIFGSNSTPNFSDGLAKKKVPVTRTIVHSHSQSLLNRDLSSKQISAGSFEETPDEDIPVAVAVELEEAIPFNPDPKAMEFSAPFSVKA